MTNKKSEIGFAETIRWYNENAAQYAQAIKAYIPHQQIAVFVDKVGPGAKILDAGCGAGRDTQLMKAAGLEPVGLDIAERLIEHAQRQYPKLHFVCASFLEIPFADMIFDGVWAHASLVHLPNIRDVKLAIAEFNRVLKPDGLLHVLVKKQPGKSKYAVVTDKLSNHDRFFQYFDVDEIKEMLATAGFLAEQTTVYNEADYLKAGRQDVEWIWILARKQGSAL